MTALSLGVGLQNPPSLPALAGGGGYGPAAERDAAAIEADLALGLITADGAARSYGHVPA